MKKLAILMGAAGLLTFAAAGQAQAAGATQESFLYAWHGGGLVDPALGKVIWVQPGGKNRVNVTYVLENLTPGNDYQLGFNIYAPFEGGGVDMFGQLTEDPIAGGAYNIFLPGIVTADSSGEASFHINIKNIEVCGDYDVVFWVGNSPAWNVPIAAIETWNVGDYVLADFAC